MGNFEHTSPAGNKWDHSQPRPKVQWWSMRDVDRPVDVMVLFSEEKGLWSWSVSIEPLIDPATMKGLIPFNVVVSGYEKDAEAAMDKAEEQYAFVKRTGELDSLLSKWRAREELMERRK